MEDVGLLLVFDSGVLWCDSGGCFPPLLSPPNYAFCLYEETCQLLLELAPSSISFHIDLHPATTNPTPRSTTSASSRPSPSPSLASCLNNLAICYFLGYGVLPHNSHALALFQASL